AIPPTLLISAIGIIDDVNQAVTMDLKEVGNDIYVIGKYEPVFGGSHFSRVTSQAANESVPVVDKITTGVYKALHRAIQSGIIRAAHDLSEGGLAVATAEMCIGGRLGMKLETNMWDDHVRVLFGECTGTLLVEVRKPDKEKFLSMFKDLPLAWLGTVTEEKVLSMVVHGSSVLDVPLFDLLKSWNTKL
ncbi:MAG TPA: AIR synthase-related protein, partial [Anaerolineales bacterium]|nr:AIR synthase-related protein [Anaerolineales bacterium]